MALKIYREFFSEAKKLRNLYLERVSERRRLTPERFVWDYWHIEEQYSLLRTPASQYFPEKLYKQFHSKLTHFAQETFGCAQISTPWLSCYIDGCYQNLHSDVMQGPWAYVYSLTDWKQRSFTGGETVLLRDEILRFWEKPFWRNGLEMDRVVEKIPAHFNQLLVFDPRVPHGVNRLNGSRDPAMGRLVIHGWFMDPCPFVVGGLQKEKKLSEFLRLDLGQSLLPLLERTELSGFLSLKLHVTRGGLVQKIIPLASSLQNLPGSTGSPESFVRSLRKILSDTQFPRTSTASQLTLPFYFE